jgi:hypothetical protein
MLAAFVIGAFLLGWLYELLIKSRERSGDVGFVRASLKFKVAPFDIAEDATWPSVLLFKIEAVV